MYMDMAMPMPMSFATLFPIDFPSKGNSDVPHDNGGIIPLLITGKLIGVFRLFFYERTQIMQNYFEALVRANFRYGRM